jgi:predicted small lipoprotein YifL
MKRMVLFTLTVAALAACGDKPQTLGTPKQDAAPYTGTGSAFTAPGWKPGDKTSWEQHLKARQQNGQNDYSKMN